MLSASVNITDADEAERRLDELVAAGDALRIGGTWAETLTDPDGRLPRYVAAVETDDGLRRRGFETLEAAKAGRSFIDRLRTEIALLTDGAVVDLNRIPLPAGASIVDERFGDSP